MIHRCYVCGNPATVFHSGEAGQWRDKSYDYFDLFGLWSCDVQEHRDAASSVVCERQGMSGPHTADAVDGLAHHLWRSERGLSGWLWSRSIRVAEWRRAWRNRHDDPDDDGLVISV